jgi:hypothetical protein
MNLIKNSEFDIWQNNLPNYWVAQQVQPVQRTFFYQSYVYLDGAETADVPMCYISQSMKVQQSALVRYFRFSHAVQGAYGATAQVWVELKLWAETNYWLQPDGTWSTTRTFITIENIDAFPYSEVIGNIGFTPVEYEVQGFPAAGQLQIRLYGAQQPVNHIQGVCFDKVELLAVQYGDIEITDIATTDDTGTANGTAAAYATTSNEPVYYSLDEIHWQESPSFYGLAYGAYTMFVRDSFNMYAEKPFNIYLDAVDAYGLYYKYQFRNHTGNTNVRNYGASSPLLISWMAKEDKPLEPIKASQAVLYLLAELSNEFEPLFTSDRRKFRMDVYTGEIETGTLLWRGYLNTELYSEPYTGDNYITSITATDGLGELKNISFTDTAGNPYTGFKSHFNIIKIILKKLALNLPLNIGCNLHETRSLGTEPLDDVYVDAGIFKNGTNPMTCLQVLQDILGLYGMRLWQQSGAWYLVRIAELLNQTYTIRQYDAGFNYTGSVEVNALAEVGLDTQHIVLENNARMEMQAGWKSVAITQQLGLKKSILKNYDFSTWITDTIPEYWAGSAIIYRRTADNAYYALIEKTYYADPVRYIKQEERLDAGGSLALEMEIAVIGVESPDEYDVAVQLELRGDNNTTYYLATQGWQTNSTSLTVEGMSPSKVDDPSWEQFDYTIPELPVSGMLSISIYTQTPFAQSVAGTAIKSVKLVPVDYQAKEYQGDTTTTLDINNSNNYNEPEIILMQGDLPDMPNAQRIYTNGLELTGALPTAQWQQATEPLTDTVLGWLKQLIDYLHTSAQPRVSFDIETESLTFGNLIKHNTVNDNVYMPAGLEWDVSNNIMAGEWFRIAGTGVINWVLTLGTWNDAAPWRDEGLWND